MRRIVGQKIDPAVLRVHGWRAVGLSHVKIFRGKRGTYLVKLTISRNKIIGVSYLREGVFHVSFPPEYIFRRVYADVKKAMVGR